MKVISCFYRKTDQQDSDQSGAAVESPAVAETQSDLSTDALNASIVTFKCVIR
jgi:hypothetical protein